MSLQGFTLYLRYAGAGLATLLWCASGGAADFPEAAQRVDRERILAAMRSEAEKGYNLLVTTTSTRFTTRVILNLVTAARGDSSDTRPLLLHYDDWYEAYRLAAGLDSAAVPEFVALQRAHKQSQYVEYGIDLHEITVKKGPQPLRAIRVTAGWPKDHNAANKYTFVDSASGTRLRVTNHRVIRYWLVEYPDMILQDDIEGIGGRPLDGALGAVFKVLGDGRAVRSVFAITPEGVEVKYAKARKGLIKVSQTTTTFADGRLLKDLPEDRPDLGEIERRLKQEIRLEYPGDRS